MDVKQYIWKVVDSNSWLIVEDCHGLLIDVIDDDNLFKKVEKLSDLTIILTHSHFDHIIGLNKIRGSNPKITVISTEKCSENLGNIYRNMSSSATAYLKFYDAGKYSSMAIKPFTCEPSDKTFSKTLHYGWQGHSIMLTAVYGHSADGLIALIDGKYLFSGDTLLSIPTVTRFPSGSKKRFFEEDIPLLASLGNVETVYPGHGQGKELEQMLLINKIQTT